MAKRVLIVATVVKKHIMQFHIPTIKMLKEMGWEVDVAAKNDYEDPDELDIPYIDNYYDISIARNPISNDNVAAYKALKQIIDNGKYDVVHCHTPMGGFLARICAKDARKRGTKVLYTVHGFHFYEGAPVKNWIFYYPAELICSKMTDVLITINNEDYEIAKAKMKAGKTEIIPGIGVDVEKYGKTRKVEHNGKTILSVGELIKRKNHMAVVRAIDLLKDSRIEYVIAGDGPLRKNLEGRATLLGYRKDIGNVYGMADIYIQPSFQEGMPMAVMEAMASGIPVLASDVRGNRDLIQGDMLFDPKDEKSIAEKIKEYLYRDNSDVVKRNYELIKKYDTDNVLRILKRIYMEL